MTTTPPGPIITVPDNPADTARIAAFTMSCGHPANVLITGRPGCNRDGCGWEGRVPTSVEFSLDGRKSSCTYCGTVQHSDGTTLDGTRIWRGNLPFLNLRWDYDEAAGRLDSHYCGCMGWD